VSCASWEDSGSKQAGSGYLKKTGQRDKDTDSEMRRDSLGTGSPIEGREKVKGRELLISSHSGFDHYSRKPRGSSGEEITENTLGYLHQDAGTDNIGHQSVSPISTCVVTDFRIRFSAEGKVTQRNGEKVRM